jgi:carboxyl-terminal processing protease
MARATAWCLASFLVAATAAAAPPEDAAQSDAVRAFAEAYAQIKSRYAEPLDDRKLVADAIRGMVRGLDPFSYYLEPEAYDGLRQETAGAFGGLGLEVSMEPEAVRVISAFEDSPASRAGLQPGDLITRFGDTSVAGMTLDQAIRQARGEPDTSVAVTYLRSGESEPRVVTLKRAVIQARTVRYTPIDPAYVHLQITHFNKNTAQRTRAMLANAQAQLGTIKGIVLDLRDNPGGLLKAAVAVSALFLPEDALVVYTESASEPSRMRLSTADAPAESGAASDALDEMLRKVPLVVLVNAGSASSAEIVAGALQSHKRATVVGTQTFGKGTVQVVLPLQEGAAIKLTTAYYFTPDGRRIQGSGLAPDLPVPGEAADGSACLPATGAGKTPDCQLERAMELLRHPQVLVRS